MKVVNEHLNFPKVELKPPNPSGYLLLAAEVDLHEMFFFWESAQKQELIKTCKAIAEKIRKTDSVLSADVFKTIVIPPGRGKFLEQRKGKVHIAKYDVAVLIETTSLDTARAFQAEPLYTELEQALKQNSSHFYSIAATNARRIGNVDHSRTGVFLFNYFFSDDTQENLDIWEYTAGWFTSETGLDNSTVLLPADKEDAQYGIVNHCRWDRLTDIVPSLIFKPSFHSYVLENFEANHVAAIPILYKLA